MVSLQNGYALEFSLRVPLSNVVCFLFFRSLREHFSWNVCVSYSFGEMLQFAPESDLLPGLKAGSGMGHSPGAEFHLLCWQELAVYANWVCEGRAEANVHMVPAVLTRDQPSNCSQTQINTEEVSLQASVMQGSALHGLDNVPQQPAYSTGNSFLALTFLTI